MAVYERSTKAAMSIHVDLFILRVVELPCAPNARLQGCVLILRVLLDDSAVREGVVARRNEVFNHTRHAGIWGSREVARRRAARARAGGIRAGILVAFRLIRRRAAEETTRDTADVREVHVHQRRGGLVGKNQCSG